MPPALISRLLWYTGQYIRRAHIAVTGRMLPGSERVDGVGTSI